MIIRSLCDGMTIDDTFNKNYQPYCSIRLKVGPRHYINTSSKLSQAFSLTKKGQAGHTSPSLGGRIKLGCLLVSQPTSLEANVEAIHDMT